MTTNNVKNIVVLGGGGAGIQVVKELCAKLPSTHHVILVTDRPKYAHVPALLRLFVKKDPNEVAHDATRKRFNEVFMPYDTFLKRRSAQLTLRIGKAIHVETHENGGVVVVSTPENDTRVPFQYLVCATGLHWEGPLKALHRTGDEAINTVIGWKVRFEKAKDIVLVGAGAVGLELAGELLDQYGIDSGRKKENDPNEEPNTKEKVLPKRSISIVHRSSLPLNDAYPESFRRDVRNRWAKSGIKFYFNEERHDYNVSRENTIRLNNGENIDADLVVFTRGAQRPNTKYLIPVNGALNEKGFVRLEQPHQPTLQVAGYPNIFVCGDIADLPGQKTLAKTPKQAQVVAYNILNIIANKKARKIYKSAPEGIFITNGQNKGAGYLGILWRPTFGDRVVSMVKGKGLFLEMGKQAVDLA